MSSSDIESVSSSPSVPPPLEAIPKEEKPRKRARHEHDLDVSNICLPRDQLLKFSSEQLTQYFKQLGRTRKFNSAEEKEIRRQRRLVKNRESAQNSRQKKKSLMEELERKIEILEEDKRKMSSEMTKLRTENKMLLDEVKTLRGNHNPISSYTKGKPSSKASLPVTSKTTVTAIFIFFFAFSIYFSASNSQTQNPFPTYVKEPIPEVSLKSSSPLYDQIREARATQRKLLELQDLTSTLSPGSFSSSTPTPTSSFSTTSTSPSSRSCPLSNMCFLTF